MVRPCASTRILPRLVLVSPIVAAFPSGAFGGAGAAVALLLLPPPQAATDNAASGTASATARRLMGLRRLIATPSRGCWLRRSVGLAVAVVVGHGATLWPTTEEGLRPRSYSSCAASESGAKENCRAIQLRPPRRSTRESSRPAASIVALSEMMLPAGAGAC